MFSHSAHKNSESTGAEGGGGDAAVAAAAAELEQRPSARSNDTALASEERSAPPAVPKRKRHITRRQRRRAQAKERFLNELSKIGAAAVKGGDPLVDRTDRNDDDESAVSTATAAVSAAVTAADDAQGKHQDESTRTPRSTASWLLSTTVNDKYKEWTIVSSAADGLNAAGFKGSYKPMWLRLPLPIEFHTPK